MRQPLFFTLLFYLGYAAALTTYPIYQDLPVDVIVPTERYPQPRMLYGAAPPAVTCPALVARRDRCKSNCRGNNLCIIGCETKYMLIQPTCVACTKKLDVCRSSCYWATQECPNQCRSSGIGCFNRCRGDDLLCQLECLSNTGICIENCGNTNKRCNNDCTHTFDACIDVLPWIWQT